MQLLKITLFALLIFDASIAIHAQTGILNGNWVPVKLEINGRQLPPATYEKQKLVINDTSYIFTAESVDKGVLNYKDGKMDIYGRDGVNAGKHITTIYKFENELLTICYNLTGDKYPEAFDTIDKPTYFMATFKRE